MILDDTLLISKSDRSAKTVCAEKVMISNGLPLMIFLDCYQCVVEEVSSDYESERTTKRQDMINGNIVDSWR
jgi:hypothetical protein